MIRVHLTGLTHPKTIRISFKRKPKMELVPCTQTFEKSFISQTEARWTSWEGPAYEVWALGNGYRKRLAIVPFPHVLRHLMGSERPQALKQVGRVIARQFAGHLSLYT